MNINKTRFSTESEFAENITIDLQLEVFPFVEIRGNAAICESLDGKSLLTFNSDPIVVCIAKYVFPVLCNAFNSFVVLNARRKFLKYFRKVSTIYCRLLRLPFKGKIEQLFTFYLTCRMYLVKNLNLSVSGICFINK